MGDFQRHPGLSFDKNISRTIDCGVSRVTGKQEREIRRCGFLVIGAWPDRAHRENNGRLCDRPAMPGSSYCSAHDECGSVPPLPLADSAAIEPLEPIEEEDADRLASLDLPRRRPPEEI